MSEPAITITTTVAVSAVGGLLTILGAAARIILVLVDKKLQADQAMVNLRIQTIAETILELKNSVEEMDKSVNVISEGLAVTKDRLNRER